MALLSRDAILNAEDRAFEEVDCPEWGGTVRLRSITGAERDRFEQSMMEQRGNSRTVNLANARARLVALCAVDADGAQLFSSEDIRALGRKNAKPLDRLFDACQRLAGLSEEDVKKITEDFDETPGEDSSID